jgi:DNA-binding NtrC family response regulator
LIAQKRESTEADTLRLAFYSQDLKLRPLLASVLGVEFQVTIEPDREKLHNLVAKELCDVLILDLDSIYCPTGQQVSFFEEIVESGIAIIVMSDDHSRATAVDLVERGAYGYFRKPPALRELKAIARKAHEHSVLKRRAGFSRRPAIQPPHCDRLMGTSSAMRMVYDLVRKVASLNASVLITGESGTGKELVARAIHNLGTRAERPFIAVSCGAIPETLIESELFGHEKGAFTGTAGTREGYLEQAGEGTLFLDEIGELSLNTQVKLLRVLQQKEFSRLGSNRLIPLGARVIFATHRDLAQMVEKGTFRRDLYYRVNVMRIACPSLAERPEDISLLARHFLAQYSEQYEKTVWRIEGRAISLLEEYGWPGNVRELENAIQSALILAEGDSIRPEDLPEQLRQTGPSRAAGEVSAASFEQMLQEFRVKLATKAIQDCNGNKTLAARNLNISRAYLHQLIKTAEEENEVA